MYYYLAVTIITSGMRVAIRFLDETTCRTEKESMEVFACLLYTSDAADERSSVDLGGRRIIKKKKKLDISR